MASQTQGLAAANAALTVNTSGLTGTGAVAFTVTGTFVGTITFEASLDGGSTYVTVAAFPLLAAGFFGQPQSTTTAIGQFALPVYGYSTVRARMSAYTSGTANVSADSSASAPLGQLYANAEGTKATYSAALGGNTPAATPTDIAVLFGTANKTRKLTRVVLTVQATAAGLIQYDLVKRVAGTQSAVNTAFAANTHVAKYDSNDSAMDTDGLSGIYTSNAASLGTLSGIIESETITVLANGLNRIEWNFGNRPSRCPTLRGITQLIAINGAGHTLLAGEKFGVAFEWTEE